MTAIGIDLGTTNSVGAYYKEDEKQAHVIPSTRADGLVPSVVMSWKGDIRVGQTALDGAVQDPANAIFSIKRLMGGFYSEEKVQDAARRVSYNVTSAGNGDDRVMVELDGRQYSPEDISALILTEIKETAQRSLGEDVTHAVITVPAYFEERQRAATRRAGELAGLTVKKIIDEPSAAAISYGFSVAPGTRQLLLVFDLGGGTFDVSLIATAQDPEGRNHFEVLDFRGDNWLGGDDFDRVIVQEVVSWIEDEYNFSPSDDKTFQLLAKHAAEKAKITLTGAPKAAIILPAAYKAPNGQEVNLDMEITRDRFDELIQPDIERCMRDVNEALTGQGYKPDDVDKVLLVGGSTLVPIVYETVVNLFGRKRVVQTITAHHAVALGAGILAGTLQGIQCPNPDCGEVNDEALQSCGRCGQALALATHVGEISVGEVTARSFGIEAVRGGERDQFEVIIPKGTPYPLAHPITRSFRTTAENFISVPVYEGTSDKASGNLYQGSIELDAGTFGETGKTVPANTDVVVSMNYTRDRELNITISIPETNFGVDREIALKRERPQQAAPETPEADERWEEHLEQLVLSARSFQQQYEQYMLAGERARLVRDVEKAELALEAKSSLEGSAASKALLVSLNSCGMASLLSMAEVAKEGAGLERAAKMSDVIGQIKEKWVAGERTGLEDLTVPLRTVVAAEFSEQEGQEEVLGEEDFGGLLKTQ